MTSLPTTLPPYNNPSPFFSSPIPNISRFTFPTQFAIGPIRIQIVILAFRAKSLGSPYKPVVVLQINDLCEWLRVYFATEKLRKRREASRLYKKSYRRDIL
ncbi:MAG: hypothetical protein VSS75_013905 [Candidatus Parabeggiatoa sp.]|nr:hypothetical protein [Candidatus Parabeggiatoa sp.]